MTARYCIDPLDPYAEAQVLVTYREGRPLPTLTAVLDCQGRDLLPDLSEACIRILQLEIAVYYGPGDPFAWALNAVDVVAAPAAAPAAA
ncbi:MULTISPECIES: hypothetical protein [unclassified Methylobacterium]|jgi:hypothetical protein|uniref:hypothetical protein n=1 Tax=unclassified Methylobacterium TaxID=2615210 RepID=UPI00135284CB|nr:hypothetical protein [Methylobacterium sp. 2A]MWV20440.1 hypothetical protein [Methylobacterium sp. 2A]